jgi:hypothetical protein
LLRFLGRGGRKREWESVRGKVLVCRETLPLLQISASAETAIDITGQYHGSRRAPLIYSRRSSVYLFWWCFIAFRGIFGGDGGDSIP